MIEMGYYTACLVIQFTEVKRKDFNQMFLHHIATVLLIRLVDMLIFKFLRNKLN